MEATMIESNAAPATAAQPVNTPPDWAERSRALNPTRSFLVQAPAGSGKTYLLTQRFLKLMSLVEKPDEIVAITFTNAAAAEMRNRILDALEKAEREPYEGTGDPEGLPALAATALAHSKRLGWQILDQPSQLRITTIDAFCRGLALQSPLSWGLLSGLGGRLDPVEKPEDLYRQAARRTLQVLKGADSPTRQAIEELLLWRDNNWQDVEKLIVDMLRVRNRWYQEFVFARDGDWEALRARLEAPFQRAARSRLETLWRLMDEVPGAVESALNLTRFACETPGKNSPHSLAEHADLPVAFADGEDEFLFLEDAVETYRLLADFLLSSEKGKWRKKNGLNIHGGFPKNEAGKAAKEQFRLYVESLADVPGLEGALAEFKRPMPLRYSEDEWRLMQHCFTVLRNAAVELQMVFAETGSVDFTEISQIALRILAPENGFPSDFAMRQADGIRHLLIDEFQDTSRNQHQLLARLIAAWPEREGRSCFCVGDPMQSIYGFREAEVELFERLRTHGLDTSSNPSDLFAERFKFEFLQLRANFRTVPSLVADLNGHFEQIFAEDDGSGVHFSAAEAARQSSSLAMIELHPAFTRSGKTEAQEFADCETDTTRSALLERMVGLIRDKLARARRLGSKEKFRIAVLGRTRSSLVRVAEALRAAHIGYRALDLVKLKDRPEVLDALSLARALLNPVDRTAWLGVLRAPWCGLTLAELHLLTSADDDVITATPVPELLRSRLSTLHAQGQLELRAYDAASRVAYVLRRAAEERSSSASSSLGTWLESVWKAMGGADTVNPEQQENLRLLWAALDKMPQGDLDLLGPGLHAALDDLYALPDPAASSDFGVQLMTIHKSKGLEFEVVLVPDLEAKEKATQQEMISWLERGLAEPDSNENQLTEFLIAPIQSKGADAGAAKKWLSRVKWERERQESRRVLYVVATRAREELHLFARPKFSVRRLSGEVSLDKPEGLLATAWPAVEVRIRDAFAVWIDERLQPKASEPEQVTSLAAQASTTQTSNLLQMPVPPISPVKPTLIRRLPVGYAPPEFARVGASPSTAGVHDASEAPFEPESHARLYDRTEGGLHSRLLGAAIHSFLERVSHLREGSRPAEAAKTLAKSLPGIAAEIRAHGLPRAAAERLAAEALAVVQKASVHLIGAWILTPHDHAEVEVRWTGLAGKTDGLPWNLRPDRIFFAPAMKFSDAGVISSFEAGIEPGWWIIDYKSSHADGAKLEDPEVRQDFLRRHREQYVGQLAAYAEVLRSLHGAEGKSKTGGKLKVTAGIFYPRLQILDVWEA